MNTFNIAVDCGKYATKVAMLKKDGNLKELYFKTRVTEQVEDTVSVGSFISAAKADAADNTYEVTYKGKDYIIGKGRPSDDNTKGTLTHTLCLYTAIAMLADNGSEVNLRVGCPMDIFRSEDQRKALRESLIPEKNVTINIRGREHHYTIKKVQFLPESMGILFLVPEYAHGDVGIIDIGGWNTNMSYYTDGALISQKSQTLENGGSHLTQALDNYLSPKYPDVDFTDDQLYEIIKSGGHIEISGRKYHAEELVGPVLKEYTENIIRHVNRSRWSPETMRLIFIGGTSAFIKDVITQIPIFKNAVFVKDSEWANVRGFARTFQ